MVMMGKFEGAGVFMTLFSEIDFLFVSEIRIEDWYLSAGYGPLKNIVPTS